MKPSILLVSLAVLLAGCATTKSHDGHEGGLDTGDIAPGAQKQVTFGAGPTVAMHCHPHPFMRHNVTLQEGAPSEAHVHILDGLDEAEYRFEPENLTVAPHAVVTYHNHGNFTHTATQRDAQG